MLPKEGFQIDSSLMALSANEETTKGASANHSAASKYQFGTPSKACPPSPSVMA